MFYFFFFKQKTAYEMRISDWSSDVCSSDLAALFAGREPCRRGGAGRAGGRAACEFHGFPGGSGGRVGGSLYIAGCAGLDGRCAVECALGADHADGEARRAGAVPNRSEEHTSELQ